MPTSPKSLIVLFACCIMLGCATQQYEAKPIDVEKNTSKLLAKDINNTDFKNYIYKQGIKLESYPFKSWGLDELTLCALYFNPKLEVAKAQLALANAQVESARQKQNPTLNGNVARSNQKNGDPSPWAFGLNVEIPIETANKREIKLEEAQANVAASRMDVADVAWQLRSQMAQDLTEYHQNIAEIAQLQNEVFAQAEITNMLQKRLDKGLGSKTELSAATLLQLKAQSDLNIAQTKTPELLTKLAADVGLTPEKFKAINLNALDLDVAIREQTNTIDSNFVNKNLQTSALLNRIDIRRSLAKYAEAEAKIKLEIAKQTPDISLSPGLAFEFGNSVWSLGFTSLLNLINKNPSYMNEAKHLREIEGAQFEALQAQIIGDLNQNYAHFTAAQENLNQAQSQYASQLQHAQKMQKQFDAGLIDRLELKQAALSNLVMQAQLLSAKFALLKSTQQIEDVMQAPLQTLTDKTK